MWVQLQWSECFHGAKLSRHAVLICFTALLRVIVSQSLKPQRTWQTQSDILAMHASHKIRQCVGSNDAVNLQFCTWGGEEGGGGELGVGGGGSWG